MSGTPVVTIVELDKEEEDGQADDDSMEIHLFPEGQEIQTETEADQQQQAPKTLHGKFKQRLASIHPTKKNYKTISSMNTEQTRTDKELEGQGVERGRPHWFCNRAALNTGMLVLAIISVGLMVGALVTFVLHETEADEAIYEYVCNVPHLFSSTGGAKQP